MSIEVMLGKTREELRDMDTRQKIGVGLAFGATAIRMMALAPILAKPDNQKWTWRDTATASLVPLSDFLDGFVARQTGGMTTLGGYVDQTLDKVAMTAVEAKLVTRGELSANEVQQRIQRDMRVNAVRHEVAEQSDGNVAVVANSRGKRSTAMRMTADIISMSPLAHRFPRAVRYLQHQATSAVIDSGEYNIEQFRSALADYEASR